MITLFYLYKITKFGENVKRKTNFNFLLKLGNKKIFNPTF